MSFSCLCGWRLSTSRMCIYCAFIRPVTEVKNSWMFWPLTLRPLHCLKNVKHQSPSDIVQHPRRMETSTTPLQKSKISQLTLQVYQTLKHIFSSIWFLLWQISLWQTRIWWLLSCGMWHLVAWQMWIVNHCSRGTYCLRVGHLPWGWSKQNSKMLLHLYRIMLNHIPEDSNLHSHQCENPKFHKLEVIFLFPSFRSEKSWHVSFHSSWLYHIP